MSGWHILLLVVVIAFIYTNIALSHRVSAFRTFQPELPVPARPSLSRPERNVSLGKLHRFISNVGIAPLTAHFGCNRDAFPCHVM